VPRLYKQPKTKPIPAGARIVEAKGGVKLAKWTDAKGKERTALLTLDGTGIRVLSTKWYGEYRDADGRKIREPLSPNKDAAQLMLNERVREAEMGRAGVRDPFAAHSKRKLAEHLEDYGRHLAAKGDTPEHVTRTVRRARRVFDGCGFVFPADLDASRVEQFLAGLRESCRRIELDPAKKEYTKAELAAAIGFKPHNITSLVRRWRLEASGNGKARRYPRVTAEALRDRLAGHGGSVGTSNHHLRAVKGFAAWMVKDRRAGFNPLVHLSLGNDKVDRRHDRRALSAAELRLLIRTAGENPVTVRGLTGPERAMLYAVAMGTGFRARELAALKPESFSLDATPPAVLLPARKGKNRRPTVQPLQADVVESLRVFLARRAAGQPVWPGSWSEKPAEVLRVDLEAAAIPYSVEGPDGPLYADFHALRHSFVALLDKSGVSVKEAMQLARHSDPKLTLAIYGKARLHDLAGAVGKLPVLLEADVTLQATGTEG
jgi:integrase